MPSRFPERVTLAASQPRRIESRLRIRNRKLCPERCHSARSPMDGALPIFAVAADECERAAPCPISSSPSEPSGSHILKRAAYRGAVRVIRSWFWHKPRKLLGVPNADSTRWCSERMRFGFTRGSAQATDCQSRMCTFLMETTGAGVYTVLKSGAATKGIRT